MTHSSFISDTSFSFHWIVRYVGRLELDAILGKIIKTGSLIKEQRKSLIQKRISGRLRQNVSLKTLLFDYLRLALN